MELNEQTLRALTANGKGKVVSVYLNLDPERFGTPRARVSQLESLLDEGRRVLGDMKATHEERQAIENDLDRLRAYIGEKLDASGAKAVAAFASSMDGLMMAVKLPAPVEGSIFIDDRPAVGPMTHLLGDRWCVLLISRRTARIFIGTTDSLEEAVTIEGHVHRQHSAGGWSQARYQRSVERDVENHVAEAAEALRLFFEDERFDHLAIGCQEEMAAEINDALHDQLQRRLRGRFDVPVELANADDVLKACEPLFRLTEETLTEQELARLEENIGRGERAATGVAAVLDALNRRAVETMYCEEGLVEVGVECPQCGFLARQGSRCPADDSKMEPRDNVLGSAMSAAIRQSAQVRRLPAERMRSLNGVAALLRF